MKRILDFRFSILDYATHSNPKSKIQNPKLLLLTGFFLLGFSAVTWACPLCKEALFDPSQLQAKLATAKGYAVSIGLLLSVPALLVGGVAALIVRARHRRQTIDTARLPR